ncbi:hypothetical protein EJB05_28204, partial [Eragrostis curvula]
MFIDLLCEPFNCPVPPAFLADQQQFQCSQSERVNSGARVEAARRLVAQANQFGRAIHLRDRYCLICGLAFGAWSCPDHLAHHAGHPHAAPASVVIVRHVAGSVVVPAGQLPLEFVEDIQAILLPDDTVVYPIHRRGPHQAAGPAGAQILGALPRRCSRNGLRRGVCGPMEVLLHEVPPRGS